MRVKGIAPKPLSRSPKNSWVKRISSKAAFNASISNCRFNLLMPGPGWKPETLGASGVRSSQLFISSLSAPISLSIMLRPPAISVILTLISLAEKNLKSSLFSIKSPVKTQFMEFLKNNSNFLYIRIYCFYAAKTESCLIAKRPLFRQSK